jgi:hypothetical protein
MLPMYIADESVYPPDLRPTSELPDVYDPAIGYGPIYTANTFLDLANIPARLNVNGDPDPFLSFAVQNESTVDGVVKPAGVYARTAVGEEWVFTGSCPRRSAGRIALKKIYTFSNQVAIPCSDTPCWNPVGFPDSDPPIPPFCECNGFIWDYNSNGYVPSPEGAYSQFQDEVMNTNVLTFDYLTPRNLLYGELEPDERLGTDPFPDSPGGAWLGASVGTSFYPGNVNDNDFGAAPYFIAWRNFYTTFPENQPYSYCTSLGALGWSTGPGNINGGCGVGYLNATCVANFDMTVDYVTIPFPS